VSAIGENDPTEITDSLNEHLRQVLPDIDALRTDRPEFFDDDMQEHQGVQALQGHAAVRSA